MNGEAGKGDAYRPVNQQKYGDNYDLIFGPRDVTPIQTWYACPTCGHGMNYRNPCPNCKETNESDQAPVYETAEVVCPYCGYPAGTRYCANCSYYSTAPEAPR